MPDFKIRAIEAPPGELPEILDYVLAVPILQMSLPDFDDVIENRADERADDEHD